MQNANAGWHLNVRRVYKRERDDINTRRMGKMSLAGDAPQGFSYSALMRASITRRCIKPRAPNFVYLDLTQ